MAGFEVITEGVKGDLWPEHDLCGGPKNALEVPVPCISTGFMLYILDRQNVSSSSGVSFVAVTVRACPLDKQTRYLHEMQTPPGIPLDSSLQPAPEQNAVIRALSKIVKGNLCNPDLTVVYDLGSYGNPGESKRGALYAGAKMKGEVEKPQSTGLTC